MTESGGASPSSLRSNTAHMIFTRLYALTTRLRHQQYHGTTTSSQYSRTFHGLCTRVLFVPELCHVGAKFASSQLRAVQGARCHRVSCAHQKQTHAHTRIAGTQHTRHRHTDTHAPTKTRQTNHTRPHPHTHTHRHFGITWLDSGSTRKSRRHGIALPVLRWHPQCSPTHTPKHSVANA
jgi:hypothetical protein